MHRFRTYAIALATVVASLVLAPRVQAQTITACSANKSGSMYRVGITGAPADCTNSTHKKETWNVQGPQGPQGPQGAQGIQGASGVSGYQVVTTGDLVVPPHGSASPTLTCPSGKKVISGGVASANGSMYHAIQVSYAAVTATGDGWESLVQNTDINSLMIRYRIVCATVTP